jgi:hypothetical protein
MSSCKCSFCLKPNWLTQEQFIREVGKFLGYPKCCTEEYIKDYKTGRPPHHMRIRAGKHNLPISSSFVPCLRHASRILDENKSIYRIFRKRINITSFPYSSEDQFKRHLKKIKKKYEDHKTKN